MRDHSLWFAHRHGAHAAAVQRATRRTKLNSLGLTILIHPNTDDPRADHLYYALWVNRSQPVNGYAMKKPGPGAPRVEQIDVNTRPSVKLET